MNKIQSQALRLGVLAGALGVASTPLFAQSLVTTSGTVVTYVGDFVPDTAGVDIPTYTVTSFDNACLDDTGNVYFRGTFADAPVTLDPTNNTAWFLGNSRSSLRMGLRAGTQAPGEPVGYLLRNASATTSALSANVRVSPQNGIVWCPSNSWDSIGMATSTQSLFGGPFSPLASQTLWQQQGDAAPGCAPETFAQTFSGISLATSGLNSNGHVFYQATLTGPTTDRFGIWEGLPGATTLVQRSNTAANGIPGTFISSGGTPFGSTVQINAQNELLYEVVLSTVTGATPATSTTDRALVFYAPATTSYGVVVREGDIAPSTSGATFNLTTATATEAWTLGQSGVNWTRTRKSVFSSELRGGDVSGTTNNVGVFLYDGTSLVMAARKGATALPTDGVYSTFLASTLMVNDSGSVCFQSTLTGGTVTTANDTSIWAGQPGSLSLVCREGQTMPGTGGSTAGSLGALSYNDQGRVFFITTLAGGTNPGQSWWLWDQALGLTPVLLPNDVVTVPSGPGAGPKTLTGVITSFTNANGDGASMRFSNTGYMALRATIAAASGGGTMLIVVRPPEIGTPFCFGDGTGTACPCGNSGAAGRGCANATYAAGAKLSASGVPGASAGTDTLILTATDIPGPGLFFQGTGQWGGGAGISFGDGLLCAGGTITRMGVVFPTGNTASYPGGLTPFPIHIAGATSAGDVRHYQCWYRDAAAFCTTDTFNLTHGLTLTWLP